MDIKQRLVGGVAILDLVGKLTIGAGDVALRGAMLAELEDGRNKIVINP